MTAYVELNNASGYPFEGWLYTTTDVLPDAPYGWTSDNDYWEVGNPIGLDLWGVHVWVHLPASSRKTVKLVNQRKGDKLRLSEPPPNPLGFFGGPLQVTATVAMPMTVVGYETDGPSIIIHCRADTELVHDAWVRWYPGQPWAEAEILHVFSNPATGDLEWTSEGVEVQFGDAVTVDASGSFVKPEIRQRRKLANGCGIAQPLLFVWPRMVRDAAGWSSIAAMASQMIGAVGIQKLWPNGNPILPADFDPAKWAVANYNRCKWVATDEVDWPPIGPNKDSSNTGSQEEQGFTRGEAQKLPGLELPIYWAALAMARRPCQHREADGTLLMDHSKMEPRGLMWDGVWHWSQGVSPYQGGKSRQVTKEETGGYWGPDVEHWLFNTLAAAQRYKGSRLCDYLMDSQARLYWHQWTTEPWWSTSDMYAARAVFYECWNAVLLHRGLRDRGVADKVKTHWFNRMNIVTLPRLQRQSAEWRVDLWDVRVNDARLGPGNWWLPYQQAMGAYGMDLAGEYFNHQGARLRALIGATAVLDCWREVNGRWEPVPTCKAGTETTAPTDPSFTFYGMALAPAVVLRHDPNHAKARAIMQFLIANAKTTDDTRWLAPEVVEMLK